MQIYLTLTRRELGSFFVSFIGYVVIALTAFLLGISFLSLIESLAGEATPMPLTELFYLVEYFWLILLFTSPIITMRLFSLEKFSGTFETLMTAPVSDLQVVLAKFTAALIFYMVLWLPLAGCVLILRYGAHDPTLLDPGTMASTFFGIFLLGCLYMSLGCFASALTKNQIVAAMTSFAIGISLFIIGYIAGQFPMQSTWTTEVLGYISMRNHMLDFSRGVIDTRHVIFYLSLTTFFLFLTYKAVESRRWK